LTYTMRQRARAYSWHLLLIGLVIGLLWAGIGFSLWHERRTAAENAVKDTANLVRTFEEDITRTIEAVDQTLLFLREAYQRDRAGFVQESRASGRAFLDELHARMALSDRNGKLVWSNPGPSTPEINIADREDFQAQRISTVDALFISKPLIDRLSGKRTIQFVRKLQAPDGSFDGVAVVSLDPGPLTRFHESISIGNGSILLAMTDGLILVRAPEREATLGEDMLTSAQIRMMQESTKGGFRAVGSFDDVDRIVSFRRLKQYPLMLAVGLAASDVFAAYERAKWFYLGIGFLLSVVSIVVGLVMASQRRLLLDSRQALAATLENISQGITMIRDDGSIPVLNQRAIELLGLPREFLETHPTYRQIVDWQFANNEFGTPDSWDGTLADVMRKSGGPQGNYTYERTRPNGTVLEIRTQTMADRGIVRTYADITERKQNEIALGAAQARAAHAERMQALGQLAGGIAHDFNNILQAVQGGAGLIERRAADAGSVRRFARMIQDATSRGTSITRRLLAFARRGELRAEPVEAGSLLLGLRDVLDHTLGSAIAVNVHLAPELPPLLADKGQLETVLVNLATNARDAMPDGGTLTLSATIDLVQEDAERPVDLQPGRYVLLSVTDTGNGMDRPILDRVLEPFFSTKPTGQGTGLGLPMAKGFVEQSGGGLSIDSNPGNGTTVCLWLPATIREQTPHGLIRPPAPIRDDSARCILLVDDEAMVRETLAASLEDAGYRVLVAADGNTALEVLHSAESVDILVTDLSMPGVDGLTVIRKGQLHRPGLPAVLLTGYAGHGAQLAVGGSLSGAFTLVRKPVTAAQLADRIEALLEVSVPG
jgi:signal transduction histidine kinase/CheY-like chemotaxis protein